MDLCRTCLATEDLTQLFYGENYNKRSKELSEVTGLQICPNDGLPQVMCQACLLLLNSALKLRHQSAISHNMLLESGYKIITTDKKETEDDTGLINSPEKDNSFSENNQEKKEDGCFKTEDFKTVHSVPKKNELTNTEEYTYKKKRPINEIVSSNKETYNVKVEIGNIVWESEIKKEKKVSFKQLLRNSMQRDLKLKNTDSKYSYLKRKVRHEQQNQRNIHKQQKIIRKDTKDDISDVTDSDVEFFPLEPSSSTDEPKDKDRQGKEEEFGLFDHILLRKRQTMAKDKLDSYLALAVTPYDKKGPVKCKVCDKELMNLRNFLNHCKIHFAAENTCEMCGKEFVSRNSMRYHQMRLHGVEKRHKCNFCDYKGVDMYQLKNHERRVHTGEKPFICDICGVSFYLRAGIAQHMRKHFAVKSIQCDRCPAMFRSRNELTGHRNKVHLMHYTYYCYLCPEKYRAIGTVRKHLARRHGVPRDRQLAIPVSKIRKNCEIIDGATAASWQNEIPKYNIMHLE